MAICESCGEDKKTHVRGLCANCYWREYQAEQRKRDKRKVKKDSEKPSQIAPRKMQHMTQSQILKNWDRMLEAAGL